jgi:DNA-binding NarL/FixJ family response regulator
VKRIRVLLADDHPVVRTGLAGMLATETDLEVVAAVASGAEAVRVAAELSPDVILMDLRMPGMDGHQAIRALASAGMVRRVIVLTTYQSDADVAPVLAAGASGYLLKDVPADDLFAAIRAVAAGGKVIAPAVAAQRDARGGAGPTARELEVLRLVARGLSNREIGAALFVSEATVKTHLLHLFEKLGVPDRTAAVTRALELGLVELEHSGARGEPRGR